MSARFSYDSSFDPPAPVVPVRISAVAAEAGILMAALVDTGADCTLIPAAVARGLRLPRVDMVQLAGLGGLVGRVPVFAATIELAGRRRLVRLVALGREAILGRDLLNDCVARLDGPGRTLTLAYGRSGRRGRG